MNFILSVLKEHSNVSHVAQQTLFDAWPQVGAADAQDFVDGPLAQLRYFDEASLS